ncbi:MAG: hypothetical protein JKX87_02010 [Cycloclasticus sp.]|nr:hypothetical protein [Cycloclasticus sp.]
MAILDIKAFKEVNDFMKSIKKPAENMQVFMYWYEGKHQYFILKQQVDIPMA